MASSLLASLREPMDPQHSMLHLWPLKPIPVTSLQQLRPLTSLQEVRPMALLGPSPLLLLQGQAQLLLPLALLLRHFLLLLRSEEEVGEMGGRQGRAAPPGCPDLFSPPTCSSEPLTIL